MSVIEPLNQHGHTIFCDDFRQDIQGKLIYTGVYPSDMIVYGVPPIVIPSFWVIARYMAPKRLAKGIATFKIFLPGEENPVLATDLDISSFSNVPQPQFDTDRVDFFVGTFVPFRLTPLVIAQSGLIRVRVYHGEDEVRIGALPVLIAQIPESSGQSPQTTP